MEELPSGALGLVRSAVLQGDRCDHHCRTGVQSGIKLIMSKRTDFQGWGRIDHVSGERVTGDGLLQVWMICKALFHVHLLQESAYRCLEGGTEQCVTNTQKWDESGVATEYVWRYNPPGVDSS